MSTSHRPAFEVDKEGLAKLVAGRGKEFLIYEMFQNAADEASRRIDISLTPIPNVPRALLRVEDDNPDGFHDLSHAYTLFAESKKKGDATKRGRFNLGEKLVLALCDRATITTTKGTVKFEGAGRSHGRARTERGTIFEGEVRMTREECSRACENVKRLLPPRDVTVTFNGESLGNWDTGLIFSFDATLPTVLGDEEGVLRPTRRRTTIQVFEDDNRKGWLYEMGIPVVATDLPVHVNVMQKVPLNTDRDNVTPAYMKEVSALVLNNLAGCDLLTDDDAAASWVTTAIEHKDIEPEAVERVLTQRFGKKRVIYDPSDAEGTKMAMSRGYTVIPGRAFSRSAWDNIRSAGAALPAGQVTPSPRPFSDHPDAPEVKTIPPDKWTPGMRAFAEYAVMLGDKLIGATINVVIAKDSGWKFGGAYGGRRLILNVSGRGAGWLEDGLHEGWDDFLIHEFGHHYESDHLSAGYYRALTRLGARLARINREEPELFTEWLTPPATS